MSDDEGLFADGGGGGFPTAGAQEFVDFGFEEDASKKMTGRRKKLQRKVKPGSFGEPAGWLAGLLACVGSPARRSRAACLQLLVPASNQPCTSGCPQPPPAETLGLSEPVLKAIKRKGYRLPTPIQRKTLPLILQVRRAAGRAARAGGVPLGGLRRACCRIDAGLVRPANGASLSAPCSRPH